MPFGRPALPLAAMRAKRIRKGSDELRRWNASASTVGSQSAAMFNLWGVDGMPIYACGQPTLDGAMAVVHKVRRALADASASRRFRQYPPVGDMHSRAQQCGLRTGSRGVAWLR